MNVVEIEHLCYTYPGADKPTLQDVDLTIEKGDFLAIVGNNGCGKSTLCKTLNGLIPQFITGNSRAGSGSAAWTPPAPTWGRWPGRWAMSTRILKTRSSAPPCWTTPATPA